MYRHLHKKKNYMYLQQTVERHNKKQWLESKARNIQSINKADILIVTVVNLWQKFKRTAIGSVHLVFQQDWVLL